MKKKILMILIIILLIIMSFNYINLLEKKSFQQTNIDNEFKIQLNIAVGDFASGFNTDDKYYDAIARVSTSTYLCEYSTYNSLCITLDNLCLYMKQKEYKDCIIKKSKQISDVLFQLSVYPENKHQADILLKLIKDISQKSS